METTIYGIPVTVVEVDRDHEPGFVWVKTNSYPSPWRRLTRSEWIGAAVDAEL